MNLKYNQIVSTSFLAINVLHFKLILVKKKNKVESSLTENKKLENKPYFINVDDYSRIEWSNILFGFLQV